MQDEQKITGLQGPGNDGPSGRSAGVNLMGADLRSVGRSYCSE